MRRVVTTNRALTCLLVRPGRPRIWFLFVRSWLCSTLLSDPARGDALRFTNPSPPSGWIEDFHPRAVEHARHTSRKPHVGGLHFYYRFKLIQRVVQIFQSYCTFQTMLSRYKETSSAEISSTQVPVRNVPDASMNFGRALR